MPGVITHCVFGQRVLRQLPKGEVRAAVRRHLRVFYLGCQGPDLFSYNFLRLAFSSHHNLGAYLHNNRVKRLFEQGFACLPAAGEERQICLAYLAGAYCHYVCDSVCHTFVYARTRFDPQKPTAQYYGRHAQLENAIDAWYLGHDYGLAYSQMPQEQIFHLPAPERGPLSVYLAKVLKGTLGDLFHRAPFSPAFVRRAMRMAMLESRLLRDPAAARQARVQKMEKYTIRFPLLSAKFITDEPGGDSDPLNLAHEPWRDPWRPQRISWEDFDQLFQKALRLAVWLVPKMEQPKQFIELLGNTNYHDEQVLAYRFHNLERAVAEGELGPAKGKTF